MATKTYKPTTPSRRNMVTPSFAEITKKKPEKNLVTVLKKNAGRNNTGRITVRHHGGGNRQKYRIIDVKRNADVTTKVIAIEYDPNRTAYIALLEDENAKRSYVIAPNGLSVGDVLYSGEHADIKTGNVLPLSAIPVGTFIHAIELYPGRGEYKDEGPDKIAVARLHLYEKKGCKGPGKAGGVAGNTGMGPDRRFLFSNHREMAGGSAYVP